MAEAVVSVVVEQLADLIIKQAAEEIDLLTGVKKKVRNLSNTLKRIQVVLADAEQRKIREETVKLWLQELEDVSYEIDDVLDEWNYIILRQKIEGTSNDNASPSIIKQRVCSFIPSSCSCFKQVVVRRDIAVKIKELSGRLDLIEKEKDKFSFITSSGVASSSQWKRVQSTSFLDESEVFGRVSDRNTLLSQLLSESRQEGKSAIQILSIIGIGGIGKTTLAQLAYNDDQVLDHYEKRGWVFVSDPFDEIRVAKAIVESLGSSSSNLNELDPLLQRVRDCIFGKRFLLVLDDVWTEDSMKWEPFKNSLNHGVPGSTILLTTRSKRVARATSSTCMIHLDVLSSSESWSLFRQIAFFGRTKTECDRLENIGMEIVGKCKGLPLAIKIMGSLMRFKNSVQEWEIVMDSNMWELEVAQVALFPHLYLSYNDLPSLIRRCFSYCVIFPKGEEIFVDDLIRLWMAQGYLNSSGSEDDMEVKGSECFEHLAMRSFFQDIDYEYWERIDSCKMHDIVHDFAHFLTKRECLIIEGARKEIDCENVRHLTWFGSGEATDILPNCNIGQPLTFFARYLKLETLTAHLLNNLKLVRVLKLDECGLKELPREIGNLIHLRYLSLSNNYEIRELPATVYDLYNLQTLNLHGCYNLQELPSGIEKLTKLRHLILSEDTMKFPVGIGELKSLQTLSKLSVGRGWNKLGYLKNLNQLRGLLSIYIRGNLDDAADAGNAHLKSKKHIHTLTFNLWENVAEDVMEALEPPPNLEMLVCLYYKGTILPTWMTSSLNNVRQMELWFFSKLTSLPPFGMLPALEKLTIWEFNQLKFVGLSLLGIGKSLLSPTIVFPKLTDLEIGMCEEWEEWEDISPEEEDDDTISIMPRLRGLIIGGCPKLKALPYCLLRKASSLEFIKLDEKEYNPSTILSKALTLAEIKAGQSDHQSPGAKEAKTFE